MKVVIIVLWVIVVFFAYSLGRLYSAKELKDLKDSCDENCKETVSDILHAAKRTSEKICNVLIRIFVETIQNSDISLAEQEKIMIAFYKSIAKEKIFKGDTQ